MLRLKNFNPTGGNSLFFRLCLASPAGDVFFAGIRIETKFFTLRPRRIYRLISKAVLPSFTGETWGDAISQPRRHAVNAKRRA